MWEEIEARLRSMEARALQGDARMVERQHSEGKLTARERIEALFDPGTFVEEFMLAETQVTDFGMAERRQPTDGVVVGTGRIDGRLVYVFAQDRTVLQGAVGQAHAEKIAYAIDTARKIGVPVVGLYDSVGARIQEGLDVTKAIGRIFHANSLASGAIPQISAILGPCIGVAAYSPALTDFTFMARGAGQMFITGPAVIKQVTGEEVTFEDLGGAKVHSEVSGCADVVTATDVDCLASIRRLLSFLPASWRVKPPVRERRDDPDRRVDELLDLVPEDSRKAYNMVAVIRRLVDEEDFFEIKPRFARNMVVGFGRLGGQPVGFVGNQPNWMAGAIDVDASDKAARFIRFCDAFGIPIISFVDVPGYLPGRDQEHGGIIRHGAKLLYAYAEATVPKLTVITRKDYGGAYCVMSPKQMGADLNLAWPTAEIAVMGPDAAVNIIYKRDLASAADPVAKRAQLVADYTTRFANPYVAAERGYIDDVIEPRETRRELLRGLELCLRKTVERPPRKHGNIPL
ncbi:MAG TPA: acyl-CoA carboxylase subunit beta [Chloroflexota bacterium]|nr:acyl-CoA carboxylase subunit beta [Chloroflexota bacterium]